jgi:hypothetical protein
MLAILSPTRAKLKEFRAESQTKFRRRVLSVSACTGFQLDL